MIQDALISNTSGNRSIPDCKLLAIYLARREAAGVDLLETIKGVFGGFPEAVSSVSSLISDVMRADGFS